MLRSKGPQHILTPGCKVIVNYAENKCSPDVLITSRARAISTATLIRSIFAHIKLSSYENASFIAQHMETIFYRRRPYGLSRSPTQAFRASFLSFFLRLSVFIQTRGNAMRTRFPSNYFTRQGCLMNDTHFAHMGMCLRLQRYILSQKAPFATTNFPIFHSSSALGK